MKRMLISAILIFFIFSTSSIIFNEVKGSTEPYLGELTDFYVVNQKLTSTKGSTLIPVGAIQGVNDVYYVEYQYEILVKDGKDLQSSVENLSFSNDNVDYKTLSNTFNFEFSYELLESVNYYEDLFGSGVDANRIIVTLRISMNEPTMEVYELLANNQLSFNSYFFVS